jgi:hypothetical protein
MRLALVSSKVGTGKTTSTVFIASALGIMRSAILTVPLVLVPVSTTGLDIGRLRPTWETLADLEPTHPLGLKVGVWLTKVRRAVPGAAGRPVRC